MAMGSDLVQPLNRAWSVGHLGRIRGSILSLAPAVIAVAVFKLAISDGGRDALSLTMAQVGIYASLAIVVWTGRAHLGGMGWAVLVMLGVITITSLTSVRPEASVRELLLWTMYLAIAVITASTLNGTRSARWMLDALVAIGLWLVLIALFMFWGANNPGLRWYATFYWPNPFASFLLLLIPLEAIRFLTGSSPRAAFVHGAAATLLSVALVLTYSRGAWISLLAVLPLLLGVLRPASWRQIIRRGLFLGILIAFAAAGLTRGAAFVSDQSVVSRAATVADPADYSIQGRLHFWRAGLLIFRDHPLTGTGPGTFGAVHARYQRDPRYYARDPHSLYVQAATEMGAAGVLGLSVVVGALVTLWTRALRQTRGREDFPLVVGVGGGVTAFFIHSGMDMTWMFPAAPAMAFALVGILAWHAERGPLPVQVPNESILWWRVAALSGLVFALMVTVVFQRAQQSYVLGQSLARAGQRRGAAAAHAQAARLNPLSARYLAAYAARAERFPEQRGAAVAALRRAMVLDSWNASHPFHLARLLLQSAGGEAEAEALLKEAIMLDRLNRPEVYRELARLYLRQGRAADADRIYREATALYVGRGLGKPSPIYLLLWPEVAGLFLDASDASARRDDLRQAAWYLEVLLREDPTAVEAALRLSKIYVKMGRRSDARLVLIQVAERVPENADIRAALDRLP